MSKRAASTGISCPGCSLNFDTETHIPFMGSCGHSMCSICVNKKNITTCSVCKLPEGFLSLQKNELAIELLTILAEKEGKKPRQEVTEKLQDPLPTILEARNRIFLTQIVNQLDPSSFTKFSRTCKTMHWFCFNNKEIKMVNDDFRMDADVKHRIPVFRLRKESSNWRRNHFRPRNYTGRFGKFFHYRENRKKIRNYPFIFKLQQLCIVDTVRGSLLAAVRSFLKEIRVEEIYRIQVFDVINWTSFVQFVKDFNPKDVVVYYVSLDRDPYITEEAATYFLHNTSIRFRCDVAIPDQRILNSPQSFLHLSGSPVSQETFKTLVMKFANSTDDMDWTLGRCSFDFGHFNLFQTVLPFAHAEPVLIDPPLVFVKENEPLHFYILRKDGKVVHCEGRQHLTFKLLEDSDYPTCLNPESLIKFATEVTEGVKHLAEESDLNSSHVKEDSLALNALDLLEKEGEKEKSFL